ncbi:hypothetical protein BH11MYX1_BH11MYX1_10720 [soil metagenome]
MAVVVVLVGCMHSAAFPPSPPVPDVRQRSHAIVEAFDRGDLAMMEPQLAAGYVHAEQGRPRDRAKELADLRNRPTDAPRVTSRVWSNEQVFVADADAVFIGEAVERSSGHAGGYSFEGRYTLAWHFEGGSWKLALWVWSPAGEASDHAFWNTIYKFGTGFEKAPNKLLVATVATLQPGRALDISMGQGRNAIYLASHGWQVTGIDFSHEGIAQARAEAAAKGVALEAIEADVARYDWGVAKYDVVTMIYAGAEPAQLVKAKAAIKPGGLFVLEYFASSVSNMGGPAPGALAEAFAGWDIVRDDVIEGVPDWALDHAAIQRFVARKR